MHDTRVVGEDGRGKYFHCTAAVALRDHNGMPLAVVETFRDITDRRRAEEVLKAGEEKYRLLVGNQTDLLVKVDAKGKFLFVSPSCCRLFGKTEAELLGEKFLSLVHPDDRRSTEMKMKNLCLPPHAASVEHRAMTKEGLRWLTWSDTAVLGDDNGVVAIVCVGRDVTEWRKTKEALRESEAKYRTLAEEIPAITYMAALDDASTTLYVSPQIENFLGVSPSDYEADPDTWQKLLHPQDRERVMAEVKRSHDTGKPFVSAYRMIGRNGRELWFRDEAAIVKDNAGKPLFLQGVMLDITGLKKAEQALQESEERYRALFEQGPDSVVLFDAETGEVVEFNERAHESLGNTRDEFRKLTIQDIEGGDSDGEIAERIKRTVMEGADVFETKHRTKTGELQDVRVSSRVLTIDGRKYIQSVWRDITEHKKAGEALRKSEEKYRFISENIPVVVYSALPDEPAPTLFISGRIEELTGYAGKHFMRDPGLWTSIIHPDDREYAGKEIQEHRTKKIPLDVEYRIVARDKSVKWVRNAATAVTGEDGKIIRVDGLIEDITRRKKVEEALQKSEEKVSAVLQSIGDPISMIDKYSNIIWANEASQRVFGDAMVGKKCHEFYHRGRGFCEQHSCIALMAIHDGKVHEQDTEFKTKDGQTRYFHCVVNVALRDHDGKPAAAIRVSRDITGRKRAEMALGESEEKYRSLVKNAPDVIFIVDRRGKIMFVNRAGAGFTVAEAVGSHVFDYVAAEHHAMLQGSIKRSFKTGELFSCEVAGRGPHDRRVWYFVRSGAIRRGGEVVALTLIATDITERRQAVERVRESEFKYRTLIENLPQRIFLKDRNSVYVSCNENYARDLKIRPDEIAGKTDCDFYPEGLAEKYRADDREIVESGETKEIEEAYVLDGEEKTVRMVKTPIKDEGGDIVGVLGIFRDITERRILEDQLRHVQKMEAVGTLAAGLAHDFNNILANILGYTNLLKKRYGKDGALVGDIEAIEGLSWRGTDITEALLAFSRKGKFYTRPLNVNRIIESVLKVIGRTAGSGLDVQANLPGDVSNVLGDEGQIHQSIMNMCINACEAMPEGGILAVSTANAALDEQFFRVHPGLKKGSYVSVKISDTGIGMDEEARARIFEPFFTTKEEKSGTGLGLAMVAGTVESHGGCIDVESAPEEGTTLAVYLPATAEKVKVAAPVPVETMRGNETLLIVDDEDDFRNTTGQWFRDLGYTVYEAASGREALKLLEETGDEFDLVLLDMIMKGMGGAETFRKMRKMVPDLAVIICTGYSVDVTTRRLLRAGAWDFIQKPFKADRLALKVREVIDNRANK